MLRSEWLWAWRIPGAESEGTNSRAALKVHWNHSISSGTPHRMTVLQDGTEILTVGHHDHGRFLLLLRYSDEERFVIVDDAGEISELTIEE